MFPNVLPLRAVLSQVLILLLAISIESWFFQRLLYLSPKNSVEYAASINLFSTCAGWLMFLCLERLISQGQRELLMGYLLLGRVNPVSVTLTVAALIIFVISFLVKWQGLTLLEFLVKSPSFQLLTPQPSHQKSRKNRPVSTRAGVILIAHTSSHVLILLILFILKR